MVHLPVEGRKVGQGGKETALLRLHGTLDGYYTIVSLLLVLPDSCE